MSDSAATFEEGDRKAYVGWVLGGLVLLVVMIVGAAFWFMHHP